jgi:hypothetical protein
MTLRLFARTVAKPITYASLINYPIKYKHNFKKKSFLWRNNADWRIFVVVPVKKRQNKTNGVLILDRLMTKQKSSSSIT